MGADTKISWANDSINFWWGCTERGVGCRNCYAKPFAARFGFDAWGPHAPRYVVASAEKTLRKLDRRAQREGRPRLVFLNSMSDFFEEHHGPVLNWDGTPSEETLDSLREKAILLADRLQWVRLLILTKRPENILQMWPPMSVEVGGTCGPGASGPCGTVSLDNLQRQNVWLGVSISTQADADRNIPELLECRYLSPVLFASAEPMIEGVDLRRYLGNGHPDRYGNGSLHDDPSECPLWYDWCNCPHIDWVIIGGESGPNARPCRVEWICSLVDQCRVAGVPCFVKQLGSNAIGLKTIGPNGSGDTMGRWEMRDPKGGDPAEWPEDLRVREFPRGV